MVSVRWIKIHTWRKIPYPYNRLWDLNICYNQRRALNIGQQTSSPSWRDDCCMANATFQSHLLWSLPGLWQSHLMSPTFPLGFLTFHSHLAVMAIADKTHIVPSQVSAYNSQRFPNAISKTSPNSLPGPQASTGPALHAL